jgi:large subunit ribosomal protein L10
VDVEKIASLPSREILISRLLAQMNAPISKLVYALNNPISKLVYALDAIKNKKN